MKANPNNFDSPEANVRLPDPGCPVINIAEIMLVGSKRLLMLSFRVGYTLVISFFCTSIGLSADFREDLSLDAFVARRRLIIQLYSNNSISFCHIRH